MNLLPIGVTIYNFNSPNRVHHAATDLAITQSIFAIFIATNDETALYLEKRHGEFEGSWGRSAVSRTGQAASKIF
jgi:hypothetical protein